MAGACAEFDALGTNSETGTGETNTIFESKEAWNKVLPEILNAVALNAWSLLQVLVHAGP